MTPLIRICDVKEYIGETVQVRGWLQRRTGKGKINFLRVRDGSGSFQAVAFRPTLGDDLFAQVKSLTTESSLLLTGVIKADERAPGIPGGYEMDVRDIEIVQIAEPYPITPKEHGIEFLLDNRHLWLRSNRQWAIARVRSTVIRAIRDWLDDRGFMNVDTPILTPAAGEGTTTLFEIDYHGVPAFLAQTGQLYNEANIFAFGKVYCFGPTFRAEKSKTRRHLQEFWMVEPEIAFCKLEELLQIEEQFVSYVVQTTLQKCAAELQLLERDTSLLQNVKPPFPRISYDEAVERIHAAVRAGVTVPPNNEALANIVWGEDFGAPHETYLASQFDRPLFVTHYPTVCKAFYMEPEPGRPEVCRSADLLAPEGYGEIIGGSERMSDPDMLLAAIEKQKLPQEAYHWYIELRRYGSVPHSGFGLGLERTVSWITGISHLREAIAFPRTLGRLTP